MSPIPDGVYKIVNAQFGRFAADLIDGIPYGPISAYPKDYCYRDCLWKVTNTGGNEVTLENCSAQLSYADAEKPVRQGSRVVGSYNATGWIPVNYGGDKYAIQTPDGNLVWELSRGLPYENIRLVPHTGKLNTRWYFQRVGDDC